MSMDSVSLGFGGTSRFSGNRGRTADGMSKSGVRYPSPFFDIGHTYLPPSLKALLRWCRYYYLVNPLINAVIHKMSEYPITEIVIDEKDPAIKEKWDTLLGGVLRYRPFQIEIGLDYYTYGICFVTIHFPFDKFLICQNCKHKEKATKTHYKWRNLDYVIECPKCHTVGPAKVQDFYKRDLNGIRLMRWNPEYVNVDPAFAGAKPVYTFELPLQVRNDVLLGKKSVLDTIPDTFIEAMKRGKFVRFADDNIFVFRRPIISQKDSGWGMPLIMPVLKDTFYLQILRKAQEAIAQEHIVPMRVLFPQGNSSSSDPYTTISLDSWKNRIEGEVAKWKYDPNYIPILPLPIGSQTIGGDGRALMLHQEMEVWSRQIVAGMGVPQEFVFGGMQYSGSNVSMRMLENMFLGYRTDHDLMLNQFTIKRIAAFMGWPAVQAHMRRFKMADDLQRSAFFFQLNQGQKISNQTLLQEVDFDPATEDARIKGELDRQIELNRKMQVAQATIQGEMQMVQARYQKMATEMVSQALQGGAPGAPQEAVAAQGGAGVVGGAPPGAPPPPEAPISGQEGPGTGAPTGPEGEMMDGQQVDPGMPQGATVSAENAQQAPAEGIPSTLMSPLNASTQGGGGMNVLYLARRAATTLQKMDEGTRMAEMNRMQMTSPQLYSLVLQIIESEKGSQENPLNPVQSPQPTLKPTRRPSSTGV
ncbi:MAG: hypothetical protein E6R04_04935 [Spirochaetes bacterium]|nr:MAG: hypothetical protein E6R04_04935 [Spirochaetota bacterium]